MTFNCAVALAVYVSLGYVFGHVTFNRSEIAAKEGKIVTPQWARFGLSVAVIIIWPIVPVALAVLYATQHWRNHV